LLGISEAFCRHLVRHSVGISKAFHGLLRRLFVRLLLGIFKRHFVGISGAFHGLLRRLFVRLLLGISEAFCRHFRGISGASSEAFC